MNRVVPFLLLALLLATGAWFAGAFRGEPAPLAREPSRPAATAAREPVTGRVVDREAAVGRRDSIRVVDADSGEVVAGATLFDVKSGEALGVTREAGELAIDFATLPEVSRLAVAADGFLHGLFTHRSEDVSRMRRERAAGGPVVVRLTRDRVSIPFRIRFVRADGALARGVSCQFAVARSDGLDRIEPRHAIAWEHHRAAAMLPGLEELPYHVGRASDRRVFTCDGEITIRFEAAGSYRCVATAAGGYAVDRLVEVPLTRTGTVEVRVDSVPPITGVVVTAADGRPIAAAEVGMVDGVREKLVAMTDRTGRFSFQPRSRDAVRIDVRRGGFEPLSREYDIGEPLRIELAERPRVPLHGRVVVRGSGTPVEGARVQLFDYGQAIAGGVTDARGAFELSGIGGRLHLEIDAERFVRYQERLAAGGGALVFELLPGALDARISAGISALIRGRVARSDGRPVAGAAVRAAPRGSPSAPSFGDREILQGRAVPDSTAVTGEDGEYAVECAHAGAIRVFAIVPGSPLGASRGIEVVLGRRYADVELVTK